jgi:hypothetical protein
MIRATVAPKAALSVGVATRRRCADDDGEQDEHGPDVLERMNPLGPDHVCGGETEGSSFHQT